MNDTVKPELLSVAERLATLPSAVKYVFRDPVNGSPGKISKAGCLKLAQLGKDAWNAWRVEFPVKLDKLKGFVNYADFSDTDFLQNSFDFSGFIFGDGADFSHSKWGISARFHGAQWGNDADFQGAEWGNWAQFQGAQWGNGADFQGAQWGNWANFQGAQWGNGADFQGAQWGSGADFQGARWGRGAGFQGAQWGSGAGFQGAQWGSGAGFQGAQWGNGPGFQGAQWGSSAGFQGAQWGNGADFQDAQWGSGAKFQGAMWGAWADFSKTHWRGWVSFSGESWEKNRQLYFDEGHFEKAKEWAAKRGLAPDSFQEIEFKEACFANGVNFSNRKFLKKSGFNSNFDFEENAEIKERTCKVPEFHGCELHQDTTFDDAKFPPASGSNEAARAYRTLKQAFNKQQALREEQRFFKLEMEEEALRERGLKRGLFWAYKHFSDYGFSVWRPLCWALGVSAVMAMLYGVLSMLGNCLLANVATCHFAPQWLTFSLLQTLPVPGVDKMAIEAAGKFLPDDGWWGVGVSVLVILHKAVVVVALFLAGLALRNLFRLK